MKMYIKVFTQCLMLQRQTYKNVVNLVDNMFVNIASKSIRRSGMYFIGNRAMLTGKTLKHEH